MLQKDLSGRLTSCEINAAPLRCLLEVQPLSRTSHLHASRQRAGRGCCDHRYRVLRGPPALRGIELYATPTSIISTPPPTAVAPALSPAWIASRQAHFFFVPQLAKL